MAAAQKAQSPGGAGQSANLKTHTKFTSTQQQEANLIARFALAGHAAHREFLEDYLNAELREHLASREERNVV